MAKQRKKKAQKKQQPRALVKVPVNRKPRISDLGFVRDHTFLKETDISHSRYYRLRRTKTEGMYSVSPKVAAVSTTMKLVLHRNSSDVLDKNWTISLWTILQQSLGPDLHHVDITVVRIIERLDDEVAKKQLKRENFFGVALSKDKTVTDQENTEEGLNHRANLELSINHGNGNFQFAAEMHVSAPRLSILEKAVQVIRSYLEQEKILKHLSFEVDHTYQDKPLMLYGPDDISKNQPIYTKMTGRQAAISSLFVNSGHVTKEGSDFLGLSIGRYVYSSAAYPLQNRRSLIVGDNENDHAQTLSFSSYQKDTWNEDYQEYLSKLVSRSYICDSRRVFHFVMSRKKGRQIAENLYDFPLAPTDKVLLNAAEGHYNILEPVHPHPESLTATQKIYLYGNHVGHIIQLLSQFRSAKDIKDNDDVMSVKGPFADAVRSVLDDFFFYYGVWPRNPKENEEDMRLFVDHHDFQKLGILGQYVLTNQGLNKSERLKDAYEELYSVINTTILTTYPVLNVETSLQMDALLKARYGVIDFADTLTGDATSTPITNLLTLAYINALVPTLENGDVIFLHGASSLISVLPLILNAVSGDKRIDLVFVEKSQEDVLKLRQVFTGKLNMVMMSLYKNELDELIDQFDLHKGYVKGLNGSTNGDADSEAIAIKYENQTADYIRLYSIYTGRKVEKN